VQVRYSELCIVIMCSLKITIGLAEAVGIGVAQPNFSCRSFLVSLTMS
jgi:hypothetical protein